jgi:hypothetical protein
MGARRRSGSRDRHLADGDLGRFWEPAEVGLPESFLRCDWHRRSGWVGYQALDRGKSRLGRGERPERWYRW